MFVFHTREESESILNSSLEDLLGNKQTKTRVVWGGANGEKHNALITGHKLKCSQ